MMEPKINPCPFCGYAGVICRTFKDKNGDWHEAVHCPGCMTMGPDKMREGDSIAYSRKVAILRWNHRARTVPGRIEDESDIEQTAIERLKSAAHASERFYHALAEAIEGVEMLGGNG